ncbi:hypothetical protein H6P81_000805 [Aristolochia fimbriata]|uniref:non-specific serine/threonine protein kinase n=1 Tax=Aristolochia fimbriata TaxID=158543 RepID=A0AAV7F8G9_ARIFI|nr:hypothetical protein H6P81_000805 [Aristolochia fimbriata]
MRRRAACDRGQKDMNLLQKRPGRRDRPKGPDPVSGRGAPVREWPETTPCSVRDFVRIHVPSPVWWPATVSRATPYSATLLPLYKKRSRLTQGKRQKPQQTDALFASSTDRTWGPRTSGGRGREGNARNKSNKDRASRATLDRLNRLCPRIFQFSALLSADSLGVSDVSQRPLTDTRRSRPAAGIATGNTLKTGSRPASRLPSSGRPTFFFFFPPEAAPPNVLHGKYELGRLLGHGTFAKVYHARHLVTGKSVAMKVVTKEKVIKVGMTDQVTREISVMNMVRHPNIVELHEVMASKSKIYFAMELVRGGELFSKVAKGRLKEDVARCYFQQLISAVDFCHSRGVYHRDLKPENLLLDEGGNLKVTDFGLSALSDHLRHDGLLHTTCGTPAYVAPEVIGKKGYDGAKADLWSCGVILFVLLAGSLPFQDDNIVAMYKKIYRGDFTCPPWFSPEARRLVTKLLDPNPNKRITVSKLVETSWFKKPLPRTLRLRDEEAAEKESKEEEERLYSSSKGGMKEQLNAFHIISLSQGFDLSPLFEEKIKTEKEEMRFATTRPASSVISKLEEVAKAVKFSVRKSETSVRLQGQERGRKGKLAIAAEIFALTPSFLVVEVKKDGGDTLEYNNFCSKELRPALKDILWENSPPSQGETPTA